MCGIEEWKWNLVFIIKCSSGFTVLSVPGPMINKTLGVFLFLLVHWVSSFLQPVALVKRCVVSPCASFYPKHCVPQKLRWLFILFHALNWPAQTSALPNSVDFVVTVNDSGCPVGQTKCCGIQLSLLKHLIHTQISWLSVPRMAQVSKSAGSYISHHASYSISG